MEGSEHGHFIVNHSINPRHDQGGVQCDGEVRAMKPSEIWKEIKPRIGDMLVAVNDIETRAEKAQEEAYQKGLSDAWEAARKICTNWVLPDSVLSKIFGMNKTIDDIMKESTASEAIEKIRAYEQRQEEIKVGDEVEGDEGGQRGVVIDSRFENSQVAVLTGNSKVYSWWSKCAIHKTGRHFPEIAEVLRKMKES